MIPGSAHALMLGGDPCEQYQIGHSVRFNRPDSPSLSRTPGATSNRTTWTFSCWVKLSNVCGSNVFGLFVNHGDGATYRDVLEIQADQIRFDLNTQASSWAGQLKTSALFRDVSAHMHIVAVLDTTNAVAADRMRIYVNGARVTSFAAQTLPAQNSLSWTNLSGVVHRIGVDPFAGSNQPLDGYLSDIHFVDGQALNPTDFGFVCPTTGQWRPKAYAGTYGVNGFYLDFSDGSAATAAALGKDRSGNNNDWTPTNLSVTAGAGQDWLEDTPTNVFCVLNPVAPVVAGTTRTISNGGLDANGAGNGSYNFVGEGTMRPASGKWYWEANVVAIGGSINFGVNTASSLVNPNDFQGSSSTCYIYQTAGTKRNNGVSTAYGAAFTTGDMIGVAFDADSGKLFFSKNGVWQNSGDPAAGTGEAFSGLVGAFIPVFGNGGETSTSTLTMNFGQRPFIYTPPAGFKALCTKNLPKSGTVTVSGSFTGNANADGPFVAMNGTPATLTINGNAVTFGTHADALANGFKLRTASASYNAAGTNTWTATIVSNYRSIFRHQNAKGN